MFYIVPTQIIECCELVRNYEIEKNVSYDYIIITRFDLTFNNTFSEYNIDWDKLNVECKGPEEINFNAGDCFHLFKRSYLEKVINSVRDCLNEKKHSHILYKNFEQNGIQMHYIAGISVKVNPNYDAMFRFTRYLV